MYKRHYHRTKRRLLSVNKWKVRLVLWGSAITLGLVAAFFALASHHADSMYHQLYNEQPMLAYALPPIGLTLIAWLTRRFFPGSEGSGIPQAIAALSMTSHAMRSKVLSLKVALAKIFLTTLGLLGGLFSTSLIYGTRQIAAYLSAYPIRIAFFCGLILSLLGFLSGGEVSLAFPFYKLLATVASYLSGIPGGIFAPSLSIGAGLGADLAQFMPNIPFSAIVMLGMVGYFTGVVQTPITAFVIVMEMTDSSSMLMPLMATALIAKAVSHLVCPTPIYQALADAYLYKTTHSENKK